MRTLLGRTPPDNGNLRVPNPVPDSVLNGFQGCNPPKPSGKP
jgi:hypothetical protein